MNEKTIADDVLEAKKKEDGESAFPRSSYGPSGDFDCEFGMTLRDWFAGQGLCGILSFGIGRENTEPKKAAKGAYEYADAMLKERKK